MTLDTIFKYFQVLSAWLENLQKDCETYLARDGLAPKHEENESALRQVLKKSSVRNIMQT